MMSSAGIAAQMGKRARASSERGQRARKAGAEQMQPGPVIAGLVGRSAGWSHLP